MNHFLEKNCFVFRRHMIINREFEALLKKNGLDDFHALMALKKVEVVKQKTETRGTVRFWVQNGAAPTQLYLKRYRYPLVREFLANCLTLSRTYAATHEWRNILKFQACGLSTMTPIAVGKRTRFPFRSESLLLTQAITPVETLEKILGNHFLPGSGQTQRELKNVLIRELAALTRKMHGEGFKHQDFYLCHILVDWTDPAHPRLYIADLHRVRQKRGRMRRGRIKDLAALNYSAPEDIITPRDRLRFLYHYDPALARDQSFIKAVIRKTARIRAHTEKTSA